MEGQWSFIERLAELDFLKQAWLETCAGKPQACVIVAESGYGKTRLAQEFYVWLSREQDPGNYWPGTFTGQAGSLEVNPRFEEAADTATDIPWLWWGLRWPDPSKRNLVASGGSVLSTYLMHLSAHLRPIELRRLRKQGRKELLKQVLDGALNFTPAGPLLIIRNLLEAMQAGRTVRETGRELGHGAKYHEERVESDQRGVVRDALFEMLRSGLPVVLLLDDAHWADSYTLGLVRELLEASARNSWPLMVVAISWEREWHRSAGLPRQEYDGPRTLREAVWSDPTWVVREMQLGKLPQAPLLQLVRQELPGLTDEQAMTIAVRADGNPFFLQQLLLLFHRDCFVDGNRSGVLSPRGKHRLHALPPSIQETLEQRFDDLEDRIRTVLGWSSVQGSRFLKKVTRQVARALEQEWSQEKVDESLAIAERPEALVQNHTDSDTAEFRNPLLHELVLRWTQDLEMVSPVRATIRQVLERSLESGEIRELPMTELLDACDLAMREFDEGATLWVRYGAVALDALKQSRFWGQYWELAERLAARMPEEGWPLAGVPFPEQMAIVDALCHGGKLEPARRVSTTLLASARSQGNIREIATSLAKVGDVERELGAFSAALSKYKESLETRRRVLSEYGETLENLQGLPSCIIGVGRTERELGDPSAALDRFRESVEVARRILSEYGETPKSLRELSVSLNHLGNVELQLGDLHSALGRYRELATITHRTVSAFGETPQSLHDHAIALLKVGDVESEIGSFSSALKRYSESLDICRRVLSELGDAPESLHDASIALERLATMELKLGDVTSAHGSSLESLGIRRRILTQLGPTPQRLRDAAISLAQVAAIEERLGDLSSARSRRIESLSICRRKLLAFGETPESLRDVSVSLALVGNAELELGDLSSALDAYMESLKIARHILSRFGETPENLVDVSIMLNKVGDVEVRLGDVPSALERHRESLEIDRRVLSVFGETLPRLRDMSVSLERLGDVELRLGDVDSALERHREGLDIARRILSEQGESPQSLSDVSDTLDSVGDAELQLGDVSSAIERYQESLDIRRRILSQFEETTQGLKDLARTTRRLAAATTDDQVKQDLLTEGMAAIRKAIERSGDLPELL